VRENLCESNSNSQFKRKSEVDQKNETTDTQPLIRYRLRQLLTKNK